MKCADPSSCIGTRLSKICTDCCTQDTTRAAIQQLFHSCKKYSVARLVTRKWETLGLYIKLPHYFSVIIIYALRKKTKKDSIISEVLTSVICSICYAYLEFPLLRDLVQKKGIKFLEQQQEKKKRRMGNVSAKSTELASRNMGN